MVADSLDRRNCLAGVDEAGLGPILGPLVVAGVALSGPRGIDPWDGLNTIVCKKRPGRTKLMVADSKKVKQGPCGFARLEQTALAFLGAWQGKLPRHLRELLEWFGVDLDRLSRCPWYRDLELPLPIAGDRDALELRVHMLKRAMEKADIEILHLATRAVDAEEFNELISATDNKGHTHFGAYSEVIGAVLQRIPTGARLVADRCGGRTHYRHSLQKTWPDARIAVIGESEEMSSYRIDRGGVDATVHFASHGEASTRACLIHEQHSWPTRRVIGRRKSRTTARHWMTRRWTPW